jgi:hypothetical protein
MDEDQLRMNAKLRGADDVKVSVLGNRATISGRFRQCGKRFALSQEGRTPSGSLGLLYDMFMRVAGKHEPLPNSREYGRGSVLGDKAW